MEMAYIRWGEKLPSGNKSRVYVFGCSNELINMNNGNFVLYKDIRELFKTKSDLEIKREVGQKLDIKNEELEVICKGLFFERDNSEWNEPFEFESKVN